MLRVFRLRDGRWLHASFHTEGAAFSTPLATNVQEIGESMGQPVDGFDVEDDADPRGDESTWVMQPPRSTVIRPPPTTATVEALAPEITFTPPTSAFTETDRKLRDAVALVRGTTSNDVTLRTITIVRGAIEFWRDSGDERAYFQTSCSSD